MSPQTPAVPRPFFAYHCIILKNLTQVRLSLFPDSVAISLAHDEIQMAFVLNLLRSKRINGFLNYFGEISLSNQ